MSKPEDISQETWDAGAKWAAEFAQWLHAGNSTGSLSPDAVRGLTDQFARTILAAKAEERRECIADLMELVLFSGKPGAVASNPYVDLNKAVAHLRKRGEVNTAHKNSEEV